VVVVVVGVELGVVSGRKVRHEERRGGGEELSLSLVHPNTGVNMGHVLEDERECIRGGVESRVL
jgi:hypothetical protein